MASVEMEIETPAIPAQFTMKIPGRSNVRLDYTDLTREAVAEVGVAYRDAMLEAWDRASTLSPGAPPTDGVPEFDPAESA